MTLDELIPLIEAGEADVVRKALRRQPELALARTSSGDTVLHLACWQKQLAMVELILAALPDVNARGDAGRTPLHYAVYEGRQVSVDLVRRLMERGANPGLKDDGGFTVAARARSEMTECLDEVLGLLGAPPAPGPRAAATELDFGDVVARVRGIESKSHTAVALSRMVEDFSTGEPVSVKRSTRGLEAVDQTLLADAEGVLKKLESSAWAEPVREWVRANVKDADVISIVERLYAR